jgi:hypothetical protein
VTVEELEQMTPGEVWEWIPEYEDHYVASDKGRIYSFNGRRGEHRFLKLTPHKCGNGALYYVVSLHKEGRQKQFMVHRLILLAFVGPCPDDMEACHWDDDSSNNRLGNLRWDTKSANELDKVRNGNHYEASKTACSQGHPYTLENTSIKSDGSRRCKTCHREQEVNRYHRRLQEERV